MFRRQTRYDTAYVGSSNLSRAALLDGVEWNVRLSRVATPSLLDKFHGTFDTYWNDYEFRDCTTRTWTGTAWTMHSPKPRDAGSTTG